jgi:phosphatidate cytidylyltransferase
LKRELAAAIAIPAVLAVLFLLPPIAFHVLVAAVALAAQWELYRLAEKTGHPAAKTVGMGGGVATLLFFPLFWSSRDVSILNHYFTPDATLLVAGALAIVFLASVAPLFSGVSPAAALGSAAATVFGVVSVALPATAMCYLRASGMEEEQFGSRALLFLLLIVWGCDSAAYYGGRRFGKRKLAPRVSPNKTIEGTISGLVGATVIGAVAGTWWLLPEFGPLRGAAAGAVASSAGQIGDLVESLWKRGAGVKDSGTFLPGHGGFYDRIDSLLYAGPALAAFVAL